MIRAAAIYETHDLRKSKQAFPFLFILCTRHHGVMLCVHAKASDVAAYIFIRKRSVGSYVPAQYFASLVACVFLSALSSSSSSANAGVCVHVVLFDLSHSFRSGPFFFEDRPA
jgi:hypothetical protein